MPGSLCAQIGTKPERPFDRRNNRGGGVVAPGEGRSIFGPPVGPFLPALISAREKGDSAACKSGSRRSQPTLLWPLIEAVDFVPPRWSLSRSTGNRLLAVSCRRLPLCLVLGIGSAGYRISLMRTNIHLGEFGFGGKRADTPNNIQPRPKEMKLGGLKVRAFRVRPCRRTPQGELFPCARDLRSAMLDSGETFRNYGTSICSCTGSWRGARQ